MVESAAFVPVAGVGDLGSGEMKIFEADGRKVLVVNVEGTYYAFDPICPHRGAPLVEGEIGENVLICPWHSSEFDLGTGECVAGPSADPLITYPLRVKDGEIQVAI